MNHSTILGLTAQTSIHAGASSSEAAIDLPIQREGHTDWPVILGSGVKGALRSYANDELDKHDVTNLFGPDTNNGSDHAGALLIGDARIVLLPVRSMTSHVKWVTCPALLKRLQNDMYRMDLNPQDLPDFSLIQAENALVADASAEHLYLEEFKFKTMSADLSALFDNLQKITDANMREDFANNLVVVSDDQFRFLCRNAVPVNAHIAIESETKTVKSGALWYQETLPAETIMYVCVSATNSRIKGEKLAAEHVLNKLTGAIQKNKYVQIGGNMTTGMGWFEVVTATATTA